MDLAELYVRIERAAIDLDIKLYRDHLVREGTFGTQVVTGVDCNGVAKFQALLKHVIKGLNQDITNLVARGADPDRCQIIFNEYLDALMDHQIDSPKMVRGVMFYWKQFNYKPSRELTRDLMVRHYA